MRIKLKARWRSTDAYIKFGLITTFLFLVFIVLVSFGSVQDERGLTINRWQAFLRASPNEMGDALAGTFSGLAFLWIIVTVLIQGKELRLQRKELAMTRSELSGQREASQEMARAMKAQVSALEAQLQLVAAERNERLFVDAGKLLGECELTFKRSVKMLSTLNSRNPMYWSSDFGSFVSLLYVKSLEEFEERFVNDLDGLLAEVNSQVREIRRGLAERLLNKRPFDKSPIDKVLDVIEGTCKLESQLAPWDQARLHRLELLDWQATLTAISNDASLWGDAP